MREKNAGMRLQVDRPSMEPIVTLLSVLFTAMQFLCNVVIF